MLEDFTPRTREDRLNLAIYEELVKVNKQLSDLCNTLKCEDDKSKKRKEVKKDV